MDALIALELVSRMPLDATGFFEWNSGPDDTSPPAHRAHLPCNVDQYYLGILIKAVRNRFKRPGSPIHSNGEISSNAGTLEAIHLSHPEPTDP